MNAALEQANEALTRSFNDAWSNRDCDALLQLVSDDVVYMVYEGGPVHRGPEAVAGAVRPFMNRFARINFDILRLNVIGPLVIHERTEHYYGPDGELDTRFHVVGLLRITEGRIDAWRDYAIPGAEQLVGPLCTQKPD